MIVGILDDIMVPAALTPRSKPVDVPADALFGMSKIAYPESAALISAPSVRHGQAVSASYDLKRIMGLPRRREPNQAEFDKMAAHWETKLGKGDVPCKCAELHRKCVRHPNNTQAWALTEMSILSAAFDPIGVGGGKTLLDLLAAMVVPDCKVAVLLLPNGLKAQLLQVDWDFYAQHWHLPNLTTARWHIPGRPYLHVVAFSELSSPKSSDLLERINPDLVIIDECHNLANASSARTKRFHRYHKAHPQVRIVEWSGSIMKKEIEEAAHLAGMALGQGSPFPLDYSAQCEWGAALNPLEKNPAPIGALSRLAREGEHIYEAFQRRLRETPGVVSYDDPGGCGSSLVISERALLCPPDVAAKTAGIERTWCRPDGEELVTALDKVRCVDQMASGFFYRWIWPHGEPEAVIREWLEARKEWHQELRERLKNPREHMDSPLLCAKAAIRHYQGYKGRFPVWASQCWPRWERVRGSARPETETVWESRFLVEDCSVWLKENVGVLWYVHDAVGQELGRSAGVPLYGPGAKASETIIQETGSRSIVASIKAHGTGKNLQMFSRALVANVPGAGDVWEQLIGRHHRPGQEADEVHFQVYRHVDSVKNALDRARDLATFAKGILGGSQKLLKATYLF